MEAGESFLWGWWGFGGWARGGKVGKDVVGDAYGASLKTYRDAYSKMKPGSDEILNQLEKDVAAACAAPAVESQGGNVYEVAPVTA